MTHVLTVSVLFRSQRTKRPRRDSSLENKPKGKVKGLWVLPGILEAKKPSSMEGFLHGQSWRLELRTVQKNCIAASDKCDDFMETGCNEDLMEHWTEEVRLLSVTV